MSHDIENIVQSCTTSQLLMSRSLRTQLPTTKKILKPKVVTFKEFSNKKKHSQERQQYYFNKHARALPPVNKGDAIFYKKTPEAKWSPGIVIKKCEEPRSFIIESLEGIKYRRNRQHILKPSSSHRRDNTCKEDIIKEGSNAYNENEIQEKEKEGSNNTSPNRLKEIKCTRYGRQIRPPKRFINESD
ncbi:hypothetical protein ACJJTC_013440 [Scirpophaga incertulas]